MRIILLAGLPKFIGKAIDVVIGALANVGPQLPHLIDKRVNLSGLFACLVHLLHCITSKADQASTRRINCHANGVHDTIGAGFFLPPQVLRGRAGEGAGINDSADD